MPSSRADTLRALAGERFDLLVIGGGITGCGVAREAALRGLRVALVEREDLASGTSSRSSRLVHGGVRYLEHGHLRLVFEASAERRRLLRLAPHLVRPLRFTWPVFAGARVPRWKLAAALALYDLLAVFRNVGGHRRLGAAAVRAAEPALRQAGLEGGASYWDAATDDARLTLATALDAVTAGAVVATHAPVEALQREGDRIAGARVRDALGGAAIAVRARVVVSAAGPWTDEVLALASPDRPPAVRGSKGSHVAVPRARIGNAGALTLTAPQDGRVFFVLPAGSHVIIGTTEVATTSPPAEVRATRAEVRYLLDAANAHFPDARLGEGDVVSAWAGIRPLAIGAAGASLGQASREHAIVASRPGLVTVTGGKLTTYRAMAEEIVDVVESALGARRSAVGARHPTRDRPLPGGGFDSLDALAAEVGRATGLGAEAAAHLARSHGTRWREVWAIAGEVPGGREPLVEGLPWLAGELAWGVTRELACTLADLLVRRTHVAFETRDAGRAVAPRAAAIVAPLLGWDQARVAAELTRYEADVARMFTIDP